MLSARQNNAKIMNEYMKTFDRNELSIRIKNGKEKSIKQQRINEANIQKRKEKRAKMNKAYMGIHNSQFGTFWITNGVDNMKWKDSKGNIPEGFYKGRVV